MKNRDMRGWRYYTTNHQGPRVPLGGHARFREFFYPGCAIGQVYRLSCGGVGGFFLGSEGTGKVEKCLQGRRGRI